MRLKLQLYCITRNSQKDERTGNKISSGDKNRENSEF